MEEKKREELSLPSYMQRKSNRKPLTPSYVQSQSQARKPGAGQRPQAIKRAPQKIQSSRVRPRRQAAPSRDSLHRRQNKPNRAKGYHPPPKQIHTKPNTALKDGPRKS